MRKETAEALIRVISSAPEKRVTVVVRGYDQFGKEYTETLAVPTNGTTAITKRKIYGKPQKA